MILDAKIEIECDVCEHFEAFDMTPLSSGAFDDRAVEGQAKSRGWIFDDDNHFCSQECKDSAS
jgi:hypothetical protein